MGVGIVGVYNNIIEFYVIKLIILYIKKIFRVCYLMNMLDEKLGKIVELIF